MLGEAVDEENQRHHHHHETQHEPCEFFDALVKRRFRLLAGETAGEFSEIGLRARGDDDRRGRTAFHARAEKADVRAFNRRNIRARVAGIGLFHRHGLAGERGLNDKKIFGAEQPHVAGNHVARRKFHHVARHEVAEWNFFRLAIAHDRGRDTDHRLELGGGVVRLRFLDEPQRDSEHHHRQHQKTTRVVRCPVRCDERDDGQHREQDHQRVAHGEVDALQPAVMLFFRDLVGAEFFQPRRRFRLGQAGGRGAVLFEDFGNVLDRRLVDEVDKISSTRKIWDVQTGHKMTILRDKINQTQSEQHVKFL